MVPGYQHLAITPHRLLLMSSVKGQRSQLQASLIFTRNVHFPDRLCRKWRTASTKSSSMSKHHSSRKFYQQKRWIINSLLLFPPLGNPLLWLTRWSRADKIGGSVLSGILLLSVLISEASEPITTVAPPPTVEAPTQAEPAPSPVYKEAIAKATSVTAELAAAETSADWNRIADKRQSAIPLEGYAIASLGDIPISSDDHSRGQVKIAKRERNYDYAIMQRDAVESALDTHQQTAEQAAAEPEASVAEEAQTELSVVIGRQ